MAKESFSRGETPVMAKIGTVGSGSTTVSTAIDLRNCVSAGIVVPSAFTGTALTFQVSHDGVTYQVHTASGGVATSLTVAQGKTYAMPADIAAWPWVKIVSGTAEGGERTVWVVRKR